MQSWLLFVAARLIPSIHTFNVKQDRTALVYYITTCKTIFAGWIIQTSILNAVRAVHGATTMGMPLHSFIIDLCQYTRVNWDVNEEHLKVMVPVWYMNDFQAIGSDQQEILMKGHRVVAHRNSDLHHPHPPQ